MPKTRNNSTVRESSLKTKNAAYLWSFISANLAIFLMIFVSKGFSATAIDQLWKRVTTKDGIIAACIPILTIVLSGVLNDEAKARMIFWRWRNPLPGCRAFTELMKTDPRIDVPNLRKKLGDLPRDPNAQNASWYRLYKKHRNAVTVSQAHQFYLLTRDMTALSMIFTLFFSFGIIIDSVAAKVAIFYVALLMAQYVVIATSARNYGIRFVLNVLAEESHSSD
jgi:hypothetical protein